MKAILSVLTLSLLSCAPQSYAQQTEDAVMQCLAEKITVSDARIKSVGSTDFIEVTVRNGLNWPVSAIEFESRVSATGLHQPEIGGVILGLTEKLNPGQSDTVLIGLFNPDRKVSPPYDVKVAVRDVKDTNGLFLIGRARELAPAPGKTSRRSCEV